MTWLHADSSAPPVASATWHRRRPSSPVSSRASPLRAVSRLGKYWHPRCASCHTAGCKTCSKAPPDSKTMRNRCAQPSLNFAGKVDAALAAADVSVLSLGTWYNEDEPEAAAAYAADVRFLARRMRDALAASPHKAALLIEPMPQHFHSADGSGTWANRVENKSNRCAPTCAPLGNPGTADWRADVMASAALDAGLERDTLVPSAALLRPLHVLHKRTKFPCLLDVRAPIRTHGPARLAARSTRRPRQLGTTHHSPNFAVHALLLPPDALVRTPRRPVPPSPQHTSAVGDPARGFLAQGRERQAGRRQGDWRQGARSAPRARLARKHRQA